MLYYRCQRRMGGPVRSAGMSNDPSERRELGVGDFARALLEAGGWFFDNQNKPVVTESFWHTCGGSYQPFWRCKRVVEIKVN